MAGGKVKPPKRNLKLTPEERKRRRSQRSQIDRVRGIFLKTGFARVADISDKELEKFLTWRREIRGYELTHLTQFWFFSP